MNKETALPGLHQIKLAFAALIAACLVLALGSSAAQAAEAGDPFEVEFNYVALTTGAAGEAIDDFVLKPGDLDGDDNPLPPLTFNGQYKDSEGNFLLPAATGIVFPPISVDVGGLVTVDGEISLKEEATGNYDEATGAMSVDAKINLMLGVDDIAALGDEIGFPIPGTGALACTFDGLDVALSTANGWPHPGAPFANTADIEDGALAGAWLYKPAMTSDDPSKQYLCDLIGGLLDDVGGLWLVNNQAEDATLDPATEDKPAAATCEPPLIGTYPDCNEPPAQTCPEGQTGTYPDCVPILSEQPAKLGAFKVQPKQKAVKKGKKVVLKLKVRNTGGKNLKGKVKIQAPKAKVNVRKQVQVNVKPGKVQTVKVPVKVKKTKKARGNAKVVLKFKGKKAVATIKIKK